MIFNTDFYEIFIPPFLLLGIASLFSFVITCFAIPVIVRVAKAKDFLANPNGRTSHLNPTPNLGGVAIFAGVIISSVLFTGITTAHELKYIIAGMIILFFVGLKDDLVPLVAYKKFIGQVITSLFIIIPGDLRITSLYGLFGFEEISYIWSLLITFLLFLALINSFNLIDGIDGLASGVGIIVSAFFAMCFISNNHLAYAIMCFILMASLAAFFLYNVFGKKNKIFLGDTGSMLIGLLLAVLAIRFLNFERSDNCFIDQQASPAVLLSILVVPLFDTARVFILRVFRGESPFVADRNHIHHRLLDLSGSHIKATLIICLVNVFIIIVALTLQNIPAELLIAIIILLAALLSYLPIYLKQKLRKSV